MQVVNSDLVPEHELSFAAAGVMGPDRTRDEAESSNQQDEHHQGIEKAGLLKVDVHVGKHAREDENRTCCGKQPPNHALAIPKQDADSEQHRNKRNAKGVCAPEAPVGAHHGHLIGQEIDSDASHDEAHRKLPESAGSASDIAPRTVCHRLQDTKCAASKRPRRTLGFRHGIVGCCMRAFLGWV